MTIRSIHKLCGLASPIRRFSCLAFCFILFRFEVTAQFAPVVGYAGTSAISSDSSAFVAWATGCSIQRGYRCIAVPDSGYASVGDSSSAIGPAKENGVVSLGDGGSAILTFAKPIINGSGFDFAVFENGFDAGPAGFAFLELAYVEVSSDGIHYVRFPAISNVQDTLQNNSVPMDGSLLNNLAGKYVYGYGTPFDLSDLIDSPGLDVNRINYVKVIDVVGSLDPIYGTRDSRGHMVNDPYPTNYASSGFDLDAVGVINQQGAAGIGQIGEMEAVQVYPNPFGDEVNIKSIESGISTVQVIDMNGKVLKANTFNQHTMIHLGLLPAGIYIIKITSNSSVFSKLLVKE
jgi:hypothetical protein